MNSPSMIEDLVFAIETKRAEWNRVLGKLTEVQCTHPNVIGKWAIKDVIAHVSWYDQQISWMVANHSMREPVSALWELSTNERNDIIHDQYKDMSLSEVKEMAQERYEHMIAVVKQLEDIDLKDASRYEGMPSDWVPVDIISQNTWLHYADHLVMIRKEFGL